MNFGFSEEQDQLRGEVRKFLDAQCPIASVRQISKTPDGYSHDLWMQLAELGYLGLLLPEAYGGASLRFEDLVLSLEEFGRSLFPSPFLSHTLAGVLIADYGTPAQKSRWLPPMAAGTCIATVAVVEGGDDFSARGIQLRATIDRGGDGYGFDLTGVKLRVPDAAAADLIIVAARSGDSDDELSLFLVQADAEGVAIESVGMLDATKRAANVKFERVRVGKEASLGEAGMAWPAIAHHLDCGALAVAAEIIGAAEAALALTVQFAKDRIQFGSPIGRYQGVKHPLADRYVDIESLKSLTYYAAWARDHQPEAFASAVSQAKAFGAETLLRMGVDGIQLHGAVGYTEEYDIQLYLRRSKWARPAYGSELHHYERIARLGDL